MRTVLWIMVSVFLLTWTIMAWATSSIIKWLVQLTDTVPTEQASLVIANATVPEELIGWLPIELLGLVQGALATVVGTFDFLIPLLSSLANVFVWGTWALISLLVLTLAAIVHVILRKIS